MLRRLLEASARASAAMPASSSPVGRVTSSPDLLPLPTAPPDNLTGATLVSSAAPLANSSRAVAAAHHPAADADPGSTPGLLALNSSSNSLYSPDNTSDELEYSILAAFSDMETVFIACISTLLPLIVALGIAFGIRHVWRKYRDRRSSGSSSSGGLPGYRGVCSRDDTAESLHQPTGQILSAQDLVNGIDGPRYFCETEVMEDGLGSPGSSLHTSKNATANGNIITLTLKNNHLIVETEERAVTMEVPTTRTQYQDNGCSVIVEVPPGYHNTASSTDDVALVHREEEQHHSSAFENTKLFGSINTGLSQSDLSIASQNPSYRYGNQLEYEPTDYGRGTTTTFKPQEASTSKWVEFDKSPDTDKDIALLKESSSQESSLEGGQDSTDSADTTTVLSNLNFVQSEQIHKPVITGAILKRDEEVMLLQEDDTFQEQQRKLGNGTLLTPEHQRLNTDDNVNSEAKSKEQQRPESCSFVPSHKRTGSIPPRLILEDSLPHAPAASLDIYSQIKTSTKSILPCKVNSPKFELLQNEVSPVEDDKES